MRAVLIVCGIACLLVLVSAFVFSEFRARYVTQQVDRLLSSDPVVQFKALELWVGAEDPGMGAFEHAGPYGESPYEPPAMVQQFDGKIEQLTRASVLAADHEAALRLLARVRRVGGGCNTMRAWATPWASIDADLLIERAATDASELLEVIDIDLPCPVKWLRPADLHRCIVALTRNDDPQARLDGLRRVPRCEPVGRDELVISPLMTDPDPRVQRFAWLMMAWLDPVAGHVGDWSNAPTEVGEAMIAAAVLTSDDPGVTLDVYRTRLSDAGQSDRYASAIEVLTRMVAQPSKPPLLVRHHPDQPRWWLIEQWALLTLVRQTRSGDDASAIEAVIVPGSLDTFTDPRQREFAAAITRAWLLVGGKREPPPWEEVGPD